MNIAVNMRLVIQDKMEGIGWFAYETMSRLAKNHPEHNFIFIFDRPVHPSLLFPKNVRIIIKGPPTRHPLLWYMWFEWIIPAILRNTRADLFISPDGYASLKTKVPTICVIHDINFIYHPEYLPSLAARYFTYFIPKFAKKASRIGTVSEYSRMDISKSFGVSEERIDVYYNGANDAYRPMNPVLQQEVRNIYTEGKPYFIFVGALSPRKNVPGLLKSFDRYCEMGGESSLVIVGDALHKTEEITECYNGMKFAKRVHFVGRLKVDELSKVMSSAISLVFIPFFEGFGIPLVEAMYCDTPVLCSNVTSLPEVVEDAALMSDPNDYESIASNMLLIETDSILRNKLIENGRLQRAKFSWELSAERVWMSIEKLTR